MVEGLNYNLLSISQLCDKSLRVIFEHNKCKIYDFQKNEVKLEGQRINDVYVIDLNSSRNKNICLMANKNTLTWQWHRKLGHASFSVLNRLVQFNLIVGLSKIKFTQHKICDACVRGKQTKSSFKLKHIVSTSKPFDLVHMDLFGPTRTLSLNDKRFGLVLVDDYSRFSWVFFIFHKK